MSNESTEPTREQMIELITRVRLNGFDVMGGRIAGREAHVATCDAIFALLRPAEREGGPICGCREAGCPHTPVVQLSRKELVAAYKARIRDLDAEIERLSALAAKGPQPCPRCQKLVTTLSDGRLHQHTRVKYGIRVTCQDEETIDEE